MIRVVVLTIGHLQARELKSTLLRGSKQEIIDAAMRQHFHQFGGHHHSMLGSGPVEIGSSAANAALGTHRPNAIA